MDGSGIRTATAAAVPRAVPGPVLPVPVRVRAPRPGVGRRGTVPTPPGVPRGRRAFLGRSPLGRAGRSVRRLLPTPQRTPFTFGYLLVLAATSTVAAHAAPSLVRALHQACSTDVAHLVRYPVAVLFASALWIAGGIASPFAAGCLLALTALERRIGGGRTVGVFLLGHLGATLATEIPVGLAVWAGRLPGTSLHRFDYGISYGAAACAGSLAGLLAPRLRWPLLTLAAAALVGGLLAIDDPLTNWGHLTALALGLATWPLVRRGKCARPTTVPRRRYPLRWRAGRGADGVPGPPHRRLLGTSTGTGIALRHGLANRTEPAPGRMPASS
ncbi:rhomboid-like protein [Streptomyces sp. NPDC048566]|uniref:rhomboid-like protein n=1 Tax=Streptomyces sp. NPDC048566 TaxID=3365569 RepID=UPI00371E1CD8